MISFLSVEPVSMESEDHVVSMCLTFYKIVKCFCKVVVPCCIPINRI